MEKRTKLPLKMKRPKKFDIKQKFGEKKKQSIIENEKIKALKGAYQEIDASKIEKLSDFPLSDKTAKALREANYIIPTKIQKESIGLALQGHDILGAAKTGSGKTLAFLIPVLEHLYCEKWSSADGLGALIISPTRELAYQIFDVLRKVGKYHDFSAGLVIGGKHVREEADRINRTNIVICTPGRLLQHMDETAYFHADNLQILVLDEADRILDLGFQQTMNAIIQNLPPERQTLLFSATQTKSVKDLARLSLKDPMYVSVHEHSQHSTPTQLTQSYLVCELQDKINLVWSFVKHHLKTKTLIFLASCKQVRFVYEVFRRMRPGVTVLSLHGAMQQMKRMAVYESFCRKQFAVMFATDIAARGLDFPAVNWVIQLDCPEDANTYIHRVGRTARYEKDGEALLVLLPTEEEAMVSELQGRKIPINKIRVNPNRQRDIRPKMESLLAADVQLKEFAQRAFVSYLKSVFFMHNKKVFDVTKLDLEGYARSLGLALTPRVRFIEREKNKQLQQQTHGNSSLEVASNKTNKTASVKVPSAGSTDEEESESEDTSLSSNETSHDSDSSGEDMERNQESERNGLNFGQDMQDNDDNLFRVKEQSQSLHYSSGDEKDMDIENITAGRNKRKIVTKYTQAKKLLKKKLKINSKVVFDEEGNEIPDVCRKPQVAAADDEEEPEGGIDITKARQRLAEEDKIDKKIYQERIKQMHRERRLKEKEKRRKKVDEEEEVGVQLDTAEDQSDLEQDPEQEKASELRSSGSESEASAEWDSADYSDYSNPSPPPKKKKILTKRSSSPDEDSSEDEVDGMDKGHSLADDELFALKLLQNT